MAIEGQNGDQNTPPADGGTPPAAGANTGTNVQPPQGQQPPSSNTPPAGANGSEDARQRGMLADLQKERRARQQLEQQFRDAQTQLESERRRVQALAGVTPRSAEESEAEEVRQRLIQVFPALGKLSDEAIDRLLSVADQQASMQETTQHYWQSHGRTMLSGLEERVSEAIGGDLNERQRKALARAYVAEAESNPEFLERHQNGDQKLIEEFAKQWVEDWLEPARRRATADAVNQQRRVPTGRDRSVQTTPPKPINFKDPKAVEDAMVESFRRHGGNFGD